MTEGQPCRHEYVKIFQRKLKGLERRLVGTRAYLPVGFNMVDFKHLSEGSFCFCTSCRKRLFPKRTQAEKEAARIERRRLKEEKERAEREAEEAAANKPVVGVGEEVPLVTEVTAEPESETDEGGSKIIDDDDDDADEDASGDDSSDDAEVDISVDELEVESVDVEDIKAEGVKLSGDDEMDESCDSLDEDS